MKRKSAALCVLALFLLPMLPAQGGGEFDVTELLASVPDHELLKLYPNESYDRLLELRESGVRTVDKWLFERVRIDLHLTRVHLRRLQLDVHYRDEMRLAGALRVHPILKDSEFLVLRRAPYHVFVESKEGEKLSAESVRWCVDNLHALYRRVHALFGDRVAIPRLKELRDPSVRALKVLLFESPESLQGYQKAIGQPLPPGHVSYYGGKDQWIVGVVPPVGAQSELARTSLLRAGAYQLLHHLKKLTMEAEVTTKEVIWTDNRLWGRCHWFKVGFAEFLANGSEGERTTSEPYLAPHRLREWKMARSRGLKEWTLQELLAVRTSQELRMRSRKKGAGQAHLASLFYAQSWAFVHFLWFYEDGKYRDRLIVYFSKELAGRSGPDVFAQIWGSGEGRDWGSVEKEWRSHVEGLGR